MKIVILDGYTTNPGDLSWDWLREYGELTVHEFTPADKTVEYCIDADIVVSNKTVLDKNVLSRLDKCKYIALLSTGYNIVDGAYARQRGIPVSNIPAYSTRAVAQLVFAFILEFCDNVGLHSSSVKSGQWTACRDFCFWNKPLAELDGKTLGIFGFGKIGQQVSKLARVFGMNVIATTANPSKYTSFEGIEFLPLSEMLGKSDFVTLHCPLTPDTEGMVNEKFISMMKPSAFLINTSRGTVVNEKALAQALNSGRLAGAGVDVLSTEPPKADNPLLGCENCFITPHVAWAAFETRERLMSILQSNFAAFANGTPQNVVN